MLFVAVCDDLQSDRLHIQNLIYDFCNRMNCEIHLLTFENGNDLIFLYYSFALQFFILCNFFVFRKFVFRKFRL